MSGKWSPMLFSVLGLMVIAVVVFLFLFGGGDYFRARWKISRIASAEVRNSAWQEFVGNDVRNPYGGILAGAFFDRVWVWGESGLKGFPVDQYTIFSLYDGCNEGVLSELNAGLAGAIGRYVAKDVRDWGGKSMAGDYVRVFTTKSDIDNKNVVLKEVYTYNFWLFMPWGMEERCEK